MIAYASASVAAGAILVNVVTRTFSISRRPDASVQHHEFDAGQIFLAPDTAQDVRVAHTFELHNPSANKNAKLKVERLSCGCATLDIDNNVLSPLDSSHVTLGYNVRYQRGERSEAAFLSTGIDEWPQQIVEVRADFYPRIQILPDLFEFKELIDGERSEYRFTVRQYMPEAESENSLQIVVECPVAQVRKVGAPISIQNHSGVRRIDQLASMTISNRGVIHLTTKEFTIADDALGVVTGRLKITSGKDTIEIPVKWKQKELIASQPRHVFFRVDKSSSEEQHRELRLSSAEDFHISSIDCDRALFAVQCDDRDRKNQHVVDVLLVGGQNMSPTSLGTILVHTDHPSQKLVRIPVSILGE